MIEDMLGGLNLVIMEFHLAITVNTIDHFKLGVLVWSLAGVTDYPLSSA